MEIKRRCLLIIVSFLVIIIIMFVLINSKTEKVCINNHCFDVELVQTQEQRNRGLMYRESLGENQGMLFVFDEEKEQSIWMKNMLIPLDIIWINNDKEIVHIEKNVQPCTEEDCGSIRPNKKAKYVLEINAGQANKASFEIGNKLIFK